MGRLSHSKGEEEGEGSASRKAHEFKTPHLNPLPFRKGERRKKPHE